MSETMRLQRAIAKSGYTSRRKAEVLILEKRVKVNNEVVSELGAKVSSDDIITIDGVELSKEAKVYYLINKPGDVLSSVSDDRGRKVVVDLINDKRRIYPVGRLDLDTTGLLMLTNDGNFTNAMIHPSYEISKVYEVIIDIFLNDTKKRQLETGIILDGEKTLPAKVVVNRFDRKKQISLVTITLREGKNRQVKRMFEAVGAKVLKLHRSQVGTLTLKDLKVGEYRKMSKEEVAKLLALAEGGKRWKRKSKNF